MYIIRLDRVVPLNVVSMHFYQRARHGWCGHSQFARHLDASSIVNTVTSKPKSESGLGGFECATFARQLSVKQEAYDHGQMGQGDAGSFTHRALPLEART